MIVKDDLGREAIQCEVKNQHNQTVWTFKKYTLNQNDFIIELELNYRYLLELEEQINELDDESDLSFIRYALNWSRASIETELYDKLSRAISDLIVAWMYKGIEEDQFDKLYKDYIEFMEWYVFLKNHYMATEVEIDDVITIKMKTEGYKPRKPTDDDLDLILMRHSQLRDTAIAELFNNSHNKAV